MNNLENLVIQAIITATSNKQDGEFKQEVPTKTIYLKVDEPTSKVLQDFGLTEYSSKTDGEKFFIIGIVREPIVYDTQGFGKKQPELSLINGEEGQNPNYKTSQPVGMNLIKGEFRGNNFYKIQALRLESPEQIEKVEAENPFGDKPAF